MLLRGKSDLDLPLLELARPDGALDLDLALRPLEASNDDHFLDAVEQHRLVASLLDACTRSGRPAPPDVVELATDHRYKRLRIGQVLGQAADALGGIPWVVCKGPTIGNLMARPELRSYNDLDILVSAQLFNEAIIALSTVGIVEINENWAPYVRYGIGEVPMLANDVFIDLHWHLIALEQGRRHLHLDPVSMLDRRTTVEHSGTPTPVLVIEDQLLHVATHCALAGGTRLDQLRDLAVIAAAGPDWSLVAERAKDFGVGRLIAQVLDRSRRLLDADIPSEFLRQLGGRAISFRRFVDGSSVVDLRRFPVVVQRDHHTATLLSVSQWCLDGARRLAGRELDWDFTDEESDLYYGRRTGGVQARSEFIDYVIDGA